MNYQTFKSLNKDDILRYLKDNKHRFLKKYQISQIALFGSYSRNEEKDDSDIDIAIKTKLSDYFVLYDFKDELEKIFHTKVDIVRLREKMNQSLKRRIQQEATYV